MVLGIRAGDDLVSLPALILEMLMVELEEKEQTELDPVTSKVQEET